MTRQAYQICGGYFFMAYPILRFEKFKRSAVYGVHAEMTRSAELHHAKGVDFLNSDIDWSKTQSNEVIVPCASINKRITSAIQSAGVKERADSVVSLGFVITVSGDFFNKDENGAPIYDEKADSYFKDALKAVVDDVFQGDWSKLQSVVLHKDETTFHIQGLADCITQNDKGEACLSAKRILSGPARMRQIQNNFYQAVSKGRDLERGELVQEGSPKKKHKSKSQYKKELVEEAVSKIVKSAEESLDSPTLIDKFRTLPIGSSKVISDKDYNEVIKALGALEAITKASEGLKTLLTLTDLDGRIKTLEGHIEALEALKNTLKDRLDLGHEKAKKWAKELPELRSAKEAYLSIMETVSVSPLYSLRDIVLQAEKTAGADFSKLPALVADVVRSIQNDSFNGGGFSHTPGLDDMDFPSLDDRE